jgi:MFS family permease
VSTTTAVTPVGGPAGRPAGYRDVVRNVDARILVVSRMATKMGMSTLSYGAITHLARTGATQFQISLVNSTQFLAALLFAVQAGVLADTLSKRSAMLIAFVSQAVLCFLIPSFLGTGVGSLMLLMFVTSALSQLITPSVKSMVALVSTTEELATTSAMVNITGGIASAIGSSFLAPILIKTTDIEVVIYVAGVLYVLGAVRAWRLPAIEQAASFTTAVHQVEWKPEALSIRRCGEWLVRNRSIGSIVLVGATAVAMFEAFNNLIPLYVKDVLNSDPANAIYIFAPAGIGYLVGAVFGPRFIHHWGERKLATIGVGTMVAGMVCFGIIDVVAPFVAWANPLRLLEFFGVELTQLVLAAGVIAAPTNFGSVVTGAAVQTYINRRVPPVAQGATFGVEEMLENLLTLFVVLLVGLVATFVGSQTVMVVAPAIILALILYFISYSSRHGGVSTSMRDDVNYLMSEEVEEPIDVESLAFGVHDRDSEGAPPQHSAETGRE